MGAVVLRMSGVYPSFSRWFLRERAFRSITKEATCTLYRFSGFTLGSGAFADRFGAGFSILEGGDAGFGLSRGVTVGLATFEGTSDGISAMEATRWVGGGVSGASGGRRTYQYQ